MAAVVLSVGHGEAGSSLGLAREVTGELPISIERQRVFAPGRSEQLNYGYRETFEYRV